MKNFEEYEEEPLQMEKVVNNLTLGSTFTIRLSEKVRSTTWENSLRIGCLQTPTTLRFSHFFISSSIYFRIE